MFNAFDIRIVGEGFRMHDGDIYYGTVGSWGMSSLRLPMWIGRNKVLDYMFLNEDFTGRQCYELGLASEVVADELVEVVGLATAKKMSKAAPIAVEEYIGNVKPATRKSYQDHVRLNIIPYVGAVPLSKLTAAMIQQMYNELQTEKGLSPKTIKNVHGVLHRALEQAQKMGYIRNNPLAAVTLPRIEKKQIKPLEDNELCAFLKEIRGDTYELVYFVTVFTGLRQGEVLGLTWDCVNFEKHTLLINKQHGKKKGTCEYCFSSLKNDRPRLIEAADGVMDALKKQQIRQQRWAARLKDGWENSDNLVFTTETGRYLCNQTVYLAFKKVMCRLHLDATRFHDLRHTYAVNSLKSGDDIKTVQENLGHQTAAFTLDVYAHATSSMKHESANRMDQYIHNVTKP